MSNHSTAAEVVAGDNLEDFNRWAQLAHDNWSKSSKSTRVKPEVIKHEIWDVLEREDFSFRSMIQLESQQLLEK